MSRVARGGRRLAVVERLHRAVAEADHHEPAAAEVARLGMDHRQGEADRHRRVHRVAALPQDVPPDLRSRCGLPATTIAREPSVTLRASGERPAGGGAGRGTGGAPGSAWGPQASGREHGERKRGRRFRRTGYLDGRKECTARGCPGRRTGSNLAVPDDYLDPRLTERRNPRSTTIDTASALEIVDLIGAEDAGVPAARRRGARGDRAAPSI